MFSKHFNIHTFTQRSMFTTSANTRLHSLYKVASFDAAQYHQFQYRVKSNRYLDWV